MRHLLSCAVQGAFLFALFLGLFGCQKEKLYLNDADLSAELDLGVGLPIGSMTVTLGDMVGNAEIENLYVDSLNNRGVFVYKGTYDRNLTYHDVDLSKYISTKTLSMNVYDKLQESSPFPSGDYIVGTGEPFTLEFPMTLHLEGINQDEDNERLDSTYIKTSHFVSTISPSNLPIQWEWIDAITLELGDVFTRKDGRILTVYDKNNPSDAHYGFGSEIPIDIDNFSFCLMKNKNPKTLSQYIHNVIDTCNFHIRFTITIPESAGVIPVQKDAAFDYTLAVQFISYYAIWGMFSPSTDMYDHDVVSLEGEWGFADMFRKASLPFSAPVVNLHLTTSIAGALRGYVDSLYVYDEADKYNDVDLGDKYKPYHFKNWLPLNSSIGDSATMSLLFDNTPTNGQIDRLFAYRPHRLGYQYHFDFDQSTSPQLRILSNTKIHLSVDYTLPFIFNEGLYFSYADTLPDIDLTQLSIDSLVASSDIIDTVRAAELKLLVRLQNTIQMQLRGVLTPLDENNQVLLDPDTQQPLRLTTTDTITIPSPSFVFSNGAWVMDKPGELVSIVTLDKSRLDLLPQIKSIVFSAIIDDSSLHNVFEQGYFTTKLTDDAYIKVGLGLSAQVNAILDVTNITTK